ncbi:MAG TPA: hypothetical protein VIE65_10720, partial [Methylobacter sp.]
MNEDSLKTALVAIIPKSLDDVIRANRDRAKLRLTTDEEVMALHQEVSSGRVKAKIEEWRFITLHALPYQDEPESIQVMLLGEVERTGHTRITSVVRKIDLDRQFVFTNSGSLYQLGKRGEGEPPFHHLTMVCSAFHDWGFGRALGVPEFF